MRKIAVLTSGGDSPGMNAAIRAVVRYGIDKGFDVYGVERGFEGLLEGDFHQMERRSVGDILQRGGTILRTARSQEFKTTEGKATAARHIKDLGLEALVVIGGEGSMTGALELSREHGINVLCLPGTIDNDLAYTDTTIGFDTAVNTVLDAITRIRDTSSAHDRTTVIEVMGRQSGDIALYSGIAGGAEYVLLPEVHTNFDDLCNKIIEGKNNRRKHSVIIKAEGFPMDSNEIVEKLAERTGKDVRLVVLSYLQRGGSPSFNDRMLATQCGIMAIDLIEREIYNKAIGTSRGEVTYFDLAEALAIEPVFKQNLYDAINILSK